MKIKNALVTLMFLLMAIPTISAQGDIAYVVKNTKYFDSNFINAINDLGYTYNLIDDSDIASTNFSQYKMILLGDERIRNVPVDNYKSLIVNPDYYKKWSNSVGSIASNSPLSAYNTDTEISITKGVEGKFQVYTRCCYDGVSLPMYYLAGRKLSCYRATATGKSTSDLGNFVVATKDSPRRVFFGITKTDFWTSESRQLFKNSIEWVIRGEDRDEDGFYTDDDCNDGDASINPNGAEIPYNGIDEDCDGFDLIDVDGDGFIAEEAGGNDCNDNDASINPDAEEILDNIDQNCVNDAPFFSSTIEDIEWDEDEILSGVINLKNHFKDWEGDQLIFSIYDTSEDQNITVHFDNGLLIFTSEENWYGEDWVIFKAEDPGGLYDTSNHMNLMVSPVNDAPILEKINDIRVVEGRLVKITPNAADIDRDNLTFTFTAPLNSSGGWQTQIGDVGNYVVTVSVSDGSLSDSQDVNINVISKIVINEFESNPKGEDSGNEWVELYNPTESDVDISNFEIWGESKLSPTKKHTVPAGTILNSNDYYIVYVSGLNNNEEFVTLYDFNSIVIDETPVFSDSNNDVKTWQRKPNGVDTDSEEDWIFQVETRGFDNDADTNTPILNPIGNKEVDENDLLEFTVSARDLGDDLITLSALNLPYGASFSNVSEEGFVEQTFSWTPSYEQAGYYEIEFIVRDGVLEDRENITITVSNVNRPPILEEIDDQSLLEDDDPIELPLNATDPDGDDLTYSIINENIREVDCEINGDNFEIIPALNWNGNAICVVEVSDRDLTDSKPVNILVEPINDSPEILEFFPKRSIRIMNNTDQIFSIVAFDVDSEIEIGWFLDGLDLNESKDNYLFNQDKGSYELEVEVTDNEFYAHHLWNVFVGDTSDFTCEEVAGYLCGKNEFCRKENVLGVKDTNSCCSVPCSPKFGEIDRCEEISDKIEVSIKNPDKGDEFKIGEKINAKLKIENNAGEDLDFDVEIHLYDTTEDDSIEDYEKSVDINENDKEEIETEFEVPEDLDEGNKHAIFIKVIEEDEKYCSEAYIPIDIGREKENVVIEEFIIEPESAVCGDYVDLEIKIKNAGSDRQDVYLTIENSELDIYEKGQEFELEKYNGDDEAVEYFSIKIPEDAPAGNYAIKATAVFEDNYSEEAELIIKECKKTEQKEGEIKQIFLQGSKKEAKIKEVEEQDKSKVILVIALLVTMLILTAIILIIFWMAL